MTARPGTSATLVRLIGVATAIVLAIGDGSSRSHLSAQTGEQTAVYDATLKAPKCGVVGNACQSGTLLVGRDTMGSFLGGGPEPNQPNTINSACPDGTSGTFHSDESNDRL